MDIGWVLLGLFLFITAIVMPWVNYGRHKGLHEEIETLKTTIRILIAKVEAIKEPSFEAVAREEIKQELPPKPIEVIDEPKKIIIAKKIITPKAVKKEKISFEQQFGARLPVWIGGVAIALAGFFLVKYSIDNHIITEQVRVVLGVISGAALLYGADWMRKKPDFANGVRISQSLSGAGIAILYLSIFAATNLYGLLNPYIGFSGMAVTTALAVYLSLKHGAPIALLGLVGGFMTPMLIGSSSPSAPLLFIYLYFVFTGLMFVIRKENWWWLSFPSIGAAGLWLVFWLTSDFFNASDAIWLGLFLIAISGTIVVTSKRKFEEEFFDATNEDKPASTLNYITIGGALILMAFVASESGFGMVEWALFGLLAAGGIGLAYFNEKLYSFVPIASVVVNVLMLSLWGDASQTEFLVTLTAFAILYIASGYKLLWTARTPMIWAGLAAGAAAAYYLLAYYAIGSLDFVVDVSYQWGFIALAFAGAAVYATKEVGEVYAYHKHREYLLAIFALAATTFISLALTIELNREFLSVAFAIQVAAIALINTKVSIKALRYIASVLAVIFAVLLSPQLLLLAQLTAYSLVEVKMHLQDSLPLVKWPLFQLGVPAAMFVGAGYLFRKQLDDNLVRGLEIAAVALIGMMGYYITRNAFHPNESVIFIKAGFFERGIITNVLFVYSLACFWLGRKYDRPTLSMSAVVLAGIAIFRIIFFDLISYNPLWSHQNVGTWPILNSLLIPYGFPIIWAYLASKELTRLNRTEMVNYVSGFTLVLLVVLVSYNVRQLFQGEYLDSDITSNAETYSYSVAWLLLGIGLLFAGTVKKDIMLRYASLAITLLAVGKVFLYDASELEGLYRVASFLGLGASLIGLSWFYTRFVFTIKNDGRKIEEK